MKGATTTIQQQQNSKRSTISKQTRRNESTPRSEAIDLLNAEQSLRHVGVGQLAVLRIAAEISNNACASFARRVRANLHAQTDQNLPNRSAAKQSEPDCTQPSKQNALDILRVAVNAAVAEHGHEREFATRQTEDQQTC